METTEIKNICQQIADIYKNKMQQAGYDQQGELMKFTWVTEHNGSMFALYFILPDYWEYAEYGRGPTKNVNGQGDVLNAIKKWIQIKHLVPSSRNGKVPTTEQLAYAITKKIHKEGFEGKHLLQQTIDETYDTLVDKLIEAITNQLEQELEKDIEKVTK